MPRHLPQGPVGSKGGWVECLAFGIGLWGDENVPCFAVTFRRVLFRASCRGAWGRERRVGGLKSWRLGLVQSLFTPVPFKLVRSPTHHFPSRYSAIRSKKRRIGAKNGGLVSMQDCQAIYLKRSWICNNVRPSTHPPYAPEPARADCRKRELIPAEKNLPKLDAFYHPSWLAA